ncbi:tyrosine-type recombinase/integrase [Dechloromonas sp. TW-R-39-2]|uniref:tyrosine-type recombinase/integrase n=1 Tax=Dechloromonas sp. TW-R-39-2 TaxID=2654218 RepID=UPI00193CCE0D|nr:site-specific integrase [Dechloromonas sp. TW-R-39-2]QRM20771.1 tyrosine-type recombinase/integrase [Dechloromonas sp. TW-R-39-2]
MGKLTDIALRNWIKAGKPLAKADGDGLTFTLSSTGTAAWVLRYRIAGSRKEITLGRYPDITLTKARELASEKRVAIFRGVDVAQEKQDRKEAAVLAERLAAYGTVKALYDEFYIRQIEGLRKSPKQVSGVFELHILPIIGSKLVTEVKPADVDRLLRPLSERGIFRTAAKVLQLTKRLFDFAMKRHLITSNPAAPFNWTDIGGKVGPRSRVLSCDEIVEFFKGMEATPNFPPYSAAALKLLLALGVRKMELLKATWDEFDLESGEWHLPKERTKTEAAIRIPLSPWVVQTLREQKKRSYNEYVFPVLRLAPGKTTRYMGETTLNHALYMLHSSLESFTVHDLRRTARTHLAALGVEPYIAEMCLNHKPKGIEAVYNVHDYFEQRKAALVQLSDLLEKCEATAKQAVAPG